MNALAILTAIISVILCAGAVDPQQNRGNCGDGHLVGTNGSFSSPNNPNNYNYYDDNSMCQWRIEVPPEYVVRLDFYEFSTASYDYVYIYEGYNASAPLLRRIQGSYPGLMSVFSSTNIVFVRLVTDGSIGARGFLATYTAIYKTSPGFCGDVHLGGSSGLFMTPNYPGNYGYELNCYWHIQVPLTPGYVIRVDFPHYYTQPNRDYISIYDGDTTSARRLRLLSGSSYSGPSVYSSTDKMLVQFTADDQTTYRGFQATYSTVDETSNPGYCGDVKLGGYNGSFTSPNYPGSYGNQFTYNCSWRITAPETSFIIRVDFTDVDVYSRDAAYVYDGYNASAPLLQKVSGTMSPLSVYSSANQIFVQFSSMTLGLDNASLRGFRASYTTLG